MNNIKILALIVLVVLSFQPAYAQSTRSQSPRYLSLFMENDQLAGLDRCFTGGFKLSWMSNNLAQPDLKPWFSWIPFLKEPNSQKTISLSFGPHIYTPDDIGAGDLIEADRPYAGVLYISLGIHNRTQDAQDLLEITLGVVGPASGGEQLQKAIHWLISGADPQGWQHQLRNELVIACVYERKWKILRQGKTDGMGFDFIPHSGAGLGNLHTYAGVGGQFRWGWKLPDDFGGLITRPGGFRNLGFRDKRRWSLYLYGGMNAMVTLRNIFLDGNTIRASHNVEKYPLTADIFLGISTSIKKTQIFLEYVFWTKRFKLETKNQILGSLNIVYSF